MRVCILNDNFYRSSGITLVIKRLAGSGAFNDVELFAAGCETVRGELSTSEETGIVPPGHYRCFRLMGRGLSLPVAIFQFARWLRQTECDLIHVHHRRLAVIANLMSVFTRVPVLFSGHLTFSCVSWFKMFAPARVTGVSPSVVAYLKRCTRATEISLVYNPYEFPDAESRPQSGTLGRVVSIGRLEPVKNHATLIEAWGLLKQRGVQAELDIFGEGPLRASLETLIAERDLADCVHLCGFATDIERRLPSYSFNVLVSEREGLPNAVVEAAARGIPSLVTDVDGSRDTLPGDLALPNAIPFGEADPLARALEIWLNNPQLVDEDGQRFYSFLKARCSPAVIGREYSALYLRMLRRTPDVA